MLLIELISFWLRGGDFERKYLKPELRLESPKRNQNDIQSINLHF